MFKNTLFQRTIDWDTSKSKNNHLVFRRQINISIIFSNKETGTGSGIVVLVFGTVLPEPGVFPGLELCSQAILKHFYVHIEITPIDLLASEALPQTYQ